MGCESLVLLPAIGPSAEFAMSWNAAGIASESYRAKQLLGGRLLTVSRAVVDVVRSYDCSRKLLQSGIRQHRRTRPNDIRRL